MTEISAISKSPDTMHMLDALTDFRLARLRFHFRLEEPASLPRYKGSTFRGAFGYALKRTLCPFEKQECEDCELRDSCCFPKFFGLEERDTRGNERRPFVLEPPLTEQQLFDKGDFLHFDLILIGQAIDLASHCCTAVEEMGHIGLGSSQTKYRLQSIERIGASGDVEKVFIRPWPIIDPEKISFAASQIPLANEPRSFESVTLEFITPLRLVTKNRPISTCEFPALFASLSGRIRDLARSYQAREIDIDFEKLKRQSNFIETVAEDAEPKSIVRYSSRQASVMTLPGIQATITYAGDLTEFVPLLALGEVIHVGKSVVFGMGKYRIRKA